MSGTPSRARRDVTRQRAVAADDDEAVDAELREVREHDRHEVEAAVLATVAFELVQLARHAEQVPRHSVLAHPLRVEPRGVEHGAAGAVDGAGVLARERACVLVAVCCPGGRG